MNTFATTITITTGAVARRTQINEFKRMIRKRTQTSADEMAIESSERCAMCERMCERAHVLSSPRPHPTLTLTLASYPRLLPSPLPLTLNPLPPTLQIEHHGFQSISCHLQRGHGGMESL